ncbi:MAG TPA: glycosyltransferase 87 family protein [Candidatus Bathyarchaeia archaeon]|nr:glycosyltransferase 87 family protein [Candidatus Bathyarchaeia archaeon]
MFEDRILINNDRLSKFKAFFTASNTSWIVFGIIILAGILVRIFLWDFSSSDMIVWKEAAEYLLQGKNPYEYTLESFQNEGMKHFYAYFPLWLYICSLILLIFPETWFFGMVKGLILLFDIQVVILLLYILQPKVKDTWRLKIPIAIWFITPIVLMTSSMHGKFDSLMFVFILAACIAHEKDNLIFESIFLSLAILTKPIALIIIPFFYRKEFREKNFRKIFSKIGLLLLPFILFSIPFLGQPLIYLQGSLGVHVTRDFDMAPLFMLLSLPFSSPEADRIIRIVLTVIIFLSWVGLIILSYFKEYDIYKSILFTFIMFNTLYWVFLVQYTVWIYTFYIPVTSKSKMKHWQLGTLTSGIIILSTVLLALLGAFVKVGL